MTDQTARAEAERRYPHDHEVDDPFGETGVARSDPYGYDEYANRAFIEGAEWASAQMLAEVHAGIEVLPRLRRWIDDSELIDLPDVLAVLDRVAGKIGVDGE